MNKKEKFLAAIFFLNVFSFILMIVALYCGNKWLGDVFEAATIGLLLLGRVSAESER